jgi:hypothetical protein
MKAFTNYFVAHAGRGTRQGRALQDFFIRLAHADSKAAIDGGGKRRFSLKQVLPIML